MRPDLVVAQTDNRLAWRTAMHVSRLLPRASYGWYVVTNGPSPEMTPAKAAEWFRLFRRNQASIRGIFENTKCGNIG